MKEAENQRRGSVNLSRAPSTQQQPGFQTSALIGSELHGAWFLPQEKTQPYESRWMVLSCYEKGTFQFI